MQQSCGDICWIIMWFNSLWPSDAYCDIKHWLRQWLAAWKQHAITWTNVYLSSKVFCTVWAIEQEVIVSICSEISLLKLLPALPGANELNLKDPWDTFEQSGSLEDKFTTKTLVSPVIPNTCDIYWSLPGQNGAILADDNFKCIFLNENDRIPIKISLKFVPRSPIDN